MRFPLLLLLAVPAVAAPPKSPLEGLAAQDVKIRFETLDTVARAGKPLTKAEVALVVDLLREDLDAVVRLKAAQALVLAQADLKLALAALVEVVDDSAEDVIVRHNVVQALGELGKGSKRVEAALVRAGELPKLTSDVVRSLMKIGAVESARKFLEHGDNAVRAAAITALDPKVAPPTTGVATAPFNERDDAFATALNSKNAEHRRAAIRSVSKRGYDRKLWSDVEIEAIRKATTDTDLDIRCTAIMAVGNLSESSKVVPILLEAVASNEVRLTDAAAFALSRAGAIASEHMGTIVEALNSSKSRITRNLLMQTIARSGEAAKPAIPTLCKLLKDPLPQIRSSAAHTLLDVGRFDPDTVAKAIKDIPTDSDKTVEQPLKRLHERFDK